MSSDSKIEWTDATWNPVRGCDKLSPGCAHCYAEAFAERFRGVKGHPYEQGFDLRLVPEKLTDPLTWKAPKRVFVNSMSDLFHDGVPFDYIDKVFAVMAFANQHTYQVLTKRGERLVEYLAMRRRSAQPWKDAARTLGLALEFQGISMVPYPLQNVRVGVSIENQTFADIRFPQVSAVGELGWNTMVSMEPLLGGVMVPSRYLVLGQRAWVIIGGESGRGARPLNVQWVRDIVTQCQSAGVAVFVKQLGAKPHDTGGNGKYLPGVMLDEYNVRYTLKDKKGGDINEFPTSLRVREFPAVPA